MKTFINIFNELNEADTKACEIKKQVFIESDKVTVKNKVEEAAPVSTNQQIIDAKKDSADKGLYTEERKDKEDRLASLKVQLAKDGDQLADDEKESIEKEIADLEAKLFPIDETDESKGKIKKSFKESVTQKDLPSNDKLSEEAKTEKEHRIMDGNKVIKKFKDNEFEKGYNEMRDIGKKLKADGKEDNLIYKTVTIKNINETGEWDDNDDEMKIWKEELRDKAEYIANEIHGSVASVSGFDKYQGPVAIISTPIHGDVQLWFDNEDDTGLSLLCKIAHVGWIQGSANDISDILSKEVIPEDEIINESEEVKGKEVLNELGTDSTIDKLIAGDELYFRNNDGLALMVRYADTYDQPEDYDEGYTQGWERGADEEFDKVQDENFAKAKQAAEEGNVWEVLEIDETTLQPNGSVYGYLYGQEELAKFLKEVREVRVVKRLEESKKICEKCGKEVCECDKSINESGEDIKKDLNIEAGSDEEAELDNILDTNYNDLFDNLDDEEKEEYNKIAATIRDLKPEEALIDVIDEIKNKAKENGLEEDLLLFAYLNKRKMNEATLINSDLKKGKEDRLASLKTQLEADGDQLSDDEKKAIEDEIAQLEKEVYTESTINEAESLMEFTNGFNFDAFADYMEKEITKIYPSAKFKRNYSNGHYLAVYLGNNDTSRFIIEAFINTNDDGSLNDGAIQVTYPYTLHYSSEDLNTISNNWTGNSNSAHFKIDEINKALEMIKFICDKFQKTDLDENKKLKENEMTDNRKPTKIEEAEVSNLKTIKSQGNIFMLEDDNKYIVGENYNEPENIIENAEIYSTKEEADKDYFNRCGITLEESVEQDLNNKSTNLYDRCYHINDREELKEIALNAIYVANNDQKIIDELNDRLVDLEKEECHDYLVKFSEAPYDFVANNYTNIPLELLREIALNAVYVANNDEAIEKEIKDRIVEYDETYKTSEKDLSKDLFGSEAEKRQSEADRALEKYLDLAREIKAGNNDTITLDSAKQLLKKAYIKAKGYYSFEPEEIDRRIAKDIPDLFGDLEEGVISDLKATHLAKKAAKLSKEKDFGKSTKALAKSMEINDKSANKLDNKAKKLENKAGKLRNEAIVKRNKSVKDFTSKK